MLRWFRVRILALLRVNQAERDLDEELRYHLTKDIERNIARGMGLEQARRAALRGFGGVEQVKEQSRDARGLRFIEELSQDIRYGARRLRQSPGLTAVILLTLGLGVGATTAIFSVVNSVLLQPLPYHNPEGLVWIWSHNLKRGDGQGPVSAADFLDWQTMNSSLSEIAAFHSQPHNLAVGSGAERVGGVSVSGNLFSMLGASPLMGRALTLSDDSPDAPKVVVLSHGLWQRLFGASADLTSSTIKLDGESHAVVGVMPPDFTFPRRNELPAGYQIPETPELWTPLSLTADQSGNRGRHYLVAIGRLKGGFTIGQAQADFSALADQLASAYPATNTGMGARVAGMQGQIVGGFRTALLVMLAAVLMVLFIACVNVASITLARTLARVREMGIRSALGAGRRRLIRQVLIESLTMYCLAGGLGVAMAFLLLYGLLAGAPRTVPRLQDAAISGPVLLFALGLSLVTSLVFGLAPALQASRVDITLAFKEGGSGGSSSGPRSRRLREALIVTEIAVTVVLLVGAGLLVRSFWRLVSVDPGFATTGVYAMDMGLSQSKYREAGQQARFFQTALERVSALPGVESAAAVYPLPLSGAEEGMGISIEGTPPLPPGQRRGVNPVWVTPDYFKTLGIRLIAGRGLTVMDGADAPQVALINQTLARRYFEGEDPIDRRVTIGWQGEKARTIVGIVADTRPKGLDQETRPEIYVPHLQWPSSFMSLVIRAGSAGPGLAEAVRNELRAIDPEQPVFNITSVEALLATSVAERRFIMLIVAMFACVALIIASVGLYGVMSFAVVQRKREIGIRMALGAGKVTVLRMFVTRAGLLAGTGTLLGLGLSVGFVRVIGGLLYQTSATDPVTYAAICSLLFVIAMAAVYVPTRKAAGVDPTATLRYE